MRLSNRFLTLGHPNGQRSGCTEERSLREPGSVASVSESPGASRSVCLNQSTFHGAAKAGPDSCMILLAALWSLFCNKHQDKKVLELSC